MLSQISENLKINKFRNLTCCHYFREFSNKKIEIGIGQDFGNSAGEKHQLHVKRGLKKTPLAHLFQQKFPPFPPDYGSSSLKPEPCQHFLIISIEYLITDYY